MSGKGVTNPRIINLLTYIILNNYLENINLQKISYSGIYNVLYIYSECKTRENSIFLRNGKTVISVENPKLF